MVNGSRPDIKTEYLEPLSRRNGFLVAAGFGRRTRIWGCDYYSRDNQPQYASVHTDLYPGRLFELGISILLLGVRAMLAPATSYVHEQWYRLGKACHRQVRNVLTFYKSFWPW